MECNSEEGHPCDAGENGEPCESCQANEKYWRAWFGLGVAQGIKQSIATAERMLKG